MLLTSSQVSVAVSSGIVILCTSALFFSGYVIQQRTLRNLRQSIRAPKPEPAKIFLPDRFKKMTTELADGTVVEIEGDSTDDSDRAGTAEQQPIVVEVTPSRPGTEDQYRQNPQQQQQQQQLQQQQQQQSPPSNNQPNGGRSKQGLGKTAPRPSPGTNDRARTVQVTADQAVKPQKPVGPAERRRKIKEELKRLAYDDKPVYYQRRLY